MPFYEDKNPLAKNYYENPELKYVKRKEENLYENPELKYHRVTGNESIGTIAGMYGVTPQALVGANPSMQGAPPAGSFVAVPRILPQGANSFTSGAQLAPPQPQFPQKDELPPAFNPSPVALALSAVPFVLPGLWERQNVPIGSFQSGSGGVNQPDSNAGMKAYYESNKPPTVEAATKAATAPARETLAEKETRLKLSKIYSNMSRDLNSIILSFQDMDITGQVETAILPTSISGSVIPAMKQMMEQRAQSGQPYVDMALITVPVSQGGMGGVWNWTTQSFDLPSTAPGAKLTPGMALNSQWELFKNNNTVDLNVMPYFISNDELAIPGYQDQEWSNYKNLRKLGGVPSDGGWIFPKSNNAPDNPLYPSPSPSGGGGSPIPKPKRGRGGGGGGGGGGVVPSTNANAVPLNPENQKIFDKAMAREVDSETAIKQLEWFLSSGYLSPDQQILAEQEVERLRIAKRLAMLTSYKTASNIWRIG